MSETERIADFLDGDVVEFFIPGTRAELVHQAAEIVRAFGLLEKRKLSVVQLPGCRVRIEKMRLTSDGENYEAEFVLWADDLLTAIQQTEGSSEE